MNKSFFVLAILILSAGLFSCANAAPVQSTFKANFSLEALVEANRQHLLEHARVSRGAEDGSQNQFTQRHENMTVRVQPDNIPAFIEAIRSGIEQALLENNARIVGSEISGSEHFSFSYNQNGLHGTIHVWGVPGEDSNYTIILLITEN
jgi:hypothetical protein